MIINNPIGKTVKDWRWGVIGYDHEVLELTFTDGDTFLVRSTTGYEDSGLDVLDTIEGVSWNEE